MIMSCKWKASFSITLIFFVLQIIQGAGHHVYADRASMFNNLVNEIGEYADKGTLPPLSPEEPDQSRRSSNQDTGATWENMVNVRYDETRDEATAHPE